MLFYDFSIEKRFSLCKKTKATRLIEVTTGFIKSVYSHSIVTGNFADRNLIISIGLKGKLR